MNILWRCYQNNFCTINMVFWLTNDAKISQRQAFCHRFHPLLQIVDLIVFLSSGFSENDALDPSPYIDVVTCSYYVVNADAVVVHRQCFDCWLQGKTSTNPLTG